MTIKTKKTQLDRNTFVKIGLQNIAREFWWVWVIPLAIMLLPLIWPAAFWWCFVISLLLILLYWGFWAIQFTGVTQMEQFKVLFQKVYYEIDSRQILFKLSEKEGGYFKWEQIREIRKYPKYYLMMVSKFQFIYLPFEIFRSEHDQKFFETIVSRKGLLAVPKMLSIRSLFRKPK